MPKISELTSAPILDDGDTFPVVDATDTVTKKGTVAQIRAFGSTAVITTAQGAFGTYVTVGGGTLPTGGLIRVADGIATAIISSTTSGVEKHLISYGNNTLAIGGLASGTTTGAPTNINIQPATNGLLAAGATGALSWTSTVVTALRDFNVSASRSLSFGTAPSTLGQVRTDLGVSTGTILGGKSSSGDQAILSIPANSVVRLGHQTMYDVDVYGANASLWGSTKINLYVASGGVVGAMLDANSMSLALPLGGYAPGANPMRMRTASVAPANGANTLTAAQHTCPYLVFVGGTASAAYSAVVPLQTGATFIVTNATSYALTFGGATGSTVPIAAGATIMVICDGGGYRAVS